MQKVSCCDRPLQPRFVLATAQLLLERGHSYRIFGNRHLKVEHGILTYTQILIQFWKQTSKKKRN